MLFPDLHTDFSGGRSGGLLCPSFEEFSTVSCDPVNVGNLVSGSSAFYKSSLNIWNLLVHILLKPGLAWWAKPPGFSRVVAGALDLGRGTQGPALVASGLEKVSFHSNLKERQRQRMLKLPHNCTHLSQSVQSLIQIGRAHV